MCCLCTGVVAGLVPAIHVFFAAML